MTSIQSLLPWLSTHIFFLIIGILLLYLAYVLFSEVFRRRIFPSQVDRRVDKVVLTESGTRKVLSVSGLRSAASASTGPVPASGEETP